MNTEDMKQLKAKADAAIERIVKENNLAIEALTEKQIVELLKQLFASGDIIRQTVIGTGAQGVIYIPFAEQEVLKSRLKAVRELCYSQHFSEQPSDAPLSAPPCACVECMLKREILELLMP